MRKNKNFSFAFFLFVFSLGALVSVSGAEAQLQYELLEKVPGLSNLNGSDLPGYLLALYKVALAIVTLSAILMLSIGGFMYMTSAGNTSAMGTAKSVIFDAIIGLVIALIAWLLLNVINPDLVDVTISNLQSVSSVAPTPGAPAGPSGIYTGTNVGGCIGCVAVTGVNIKPVGQGCANPGPCQLNAAFLGKLQGIIYTNNSWQITEAWPPTVAHSSSCHANGTCADINFTTTTITNHVDVKDFYTAIKNSGLNAVYETMLSCNPYTAAGVLCKRYNTTTGAHFHVY